MSKKSRLRRPLNRQQDKRAETLIQSQQQRLTYLLITVKVIELEKALISDLENLKTVC